MSNSTASFSAAGDVYGFDGYDPTASVKDSADDSVLPGGSNGAILPPAMEMSSEEGFALREWRRLNAIRLAEKEMVEKELLKEIIAEADEFKREFYSKREITVEKRKASNRDKEKQVLAGQESFHAEAGENYWKAIAELIPREVPSIEKRGKKEKDKKPSITVLHGPKPGKPTDMVRMRQILVKLKHNVPDHMKPKPPQPKEETAKDGDGKGGPAKAGTNGTSGAVGSL